MCCYTCEMGYSKFYLGYHGFLDQLSLLESRSGKDWCTCYAIKTASYLKIEMQNIYVFNILSGYSNRFNCSVWKVLSNHIFN